MIIKEDRYCEVCGGFVGTMSDKAWENMERICDLCVEEGIYFKDVDLNRPWIEGGKNEY